MAPPPAQVALNLGLREAQLLSRESDHAQRVRVAVDPRAARAEAFGHLVRRQKWVGLVGPIVPLRLRLYEPSRQQRYDRRDLLTRDRREDRRW